MAWCVFRYRAREGHARRLRAREQAAGGLAHRGDRRGRRGDAGTRPLRLEPVRDGAGGCDGYRDRRRSNGVGATGCRGPMDASARWTSAWSNPDNPLGLVPNDRGRAGRRRHRGDDLHLPIGRPVKVLLRSIDVLHDFYVPEFRAKMDMIPGSVTYFWFTPTRTGTFEVLCAELCGRACRSCAGRVVVADRGGAPGVAERPDGASRSCRRDDARLPRRERAANAVRRGPGPDRRGGRKAVR